LASNRPVFDLYWHGSGQYRLSQEQLVFLDKVQQICNIDFKQNKIEKGVLFCERYAKRMLLKADITFDELCCISEQCAHSCNLIISKRFKRFYPLKHLASHLLGYLSSREKHYITKGLSGLERMFQQKLKGEVGYVLHVINSKGKKLDQKDFKGARAGNDIKLTLDARLQRVAESLFEKDQSGAFILMNPLDGSIISMVSFPNFDPNIFLTPISYDVWENELNHNSTLLNRATSASYPPASIFKLITFAAGLQEGIIDDNTAFECKGFISFCSRKHHCIRRWGHGELDSKTALAYSCNIPCFQIAQEIKINQLADYAYRFGFGCKTGFLLNECCGLVPTYEWKVATKGERWWKGETLSASIGQSYTLVTPLQVARMVSAICTGFLIKPRILEEEEIKAEELYIEEKTLEFLRKAMSDVVRFGSAKILNRLKDFAVFAKTGTAQTASLDRQRISKEQLEHAWLASYFRYKDDDPLTLVVLVEHVGTSAPARKIAFKFLQAYKRLKEGI
jgi:penicillin-binding protein 2